MQRGIPKKSLEAKIIVKDGEVFSFSSSFFNSEIEVSSKAVLRLSANGDKVWGLQQGFSIIKKSWMVLLILDFQKNLPNIFRRML